MGRLVLGDVGIAKVLEQPSPEIVGLADVDPLTVSVDAIYAGLVRCQPFDAWTREGLGSLLGEGHYDFFSTCGIARRHIYQIDMFVSIKLIGSSTRCFCLVSAVSHASTTEMTSLISHSRFVTPAAIAGVTLSVW